MSDNNKRPFHRLAAGNDLGSEASPTIELVVTLMKPNLEMHLEPTPGTGAPQVCTGNPLCYCVGVSGCACDRVCSCDQVCTKDPACSCVGDTCSCVSDTCSCQGYSCPCVVTYCPSNPGPCVGYMCPCQCLTTCFFT